ncbi:MAG: hypothetical protein JSU05_13170 [Bacteroidetes bacterium]|nr:hypothetical protein [Bacteroidota bacterium]
MQTKKLSLANIQGRMSRAEMKIINGGTMPGGGGGCQDHCTAGMSCTLDPITGTQGSCTGWENCNGTDGVVYPVRTCKAKADN